MSSSPFKTGLQIIDKPRFGYPDHFILRSKSREDAEKKIRDVVEREPHGEDIHVTYYGFRPDQPVPTAMYFCEIEIKREHERKETGRRARIV